MNKLKLILIVASLTFSAALIFVASEGAQYVQAQAPDGAGGNLGDDRPAGAGGSCGNTPSGGTGGSVGSGGSGGCAGGGCDHGNGGGSSGGGTTQCSDRIDNDGDGKRDFNVVTVTQTVDRGQNNSQNVTTSYPKDPGCSSAADNDETDSVQPVSISCSPTSINRGGSAQISWTCPGGGCYGVNFSPSGGSPKTVTPTQTTTYTIYKGLFGRFSSIGYASCTVKVATTPSTPTTPTTTPSGPVSIDITASPGQVRRGETAMVSWTSSGVTSCVVDRPTGADWTGLSGSEETDPIVSENLFTLKCQSAGGEVTDSVTVKALPTFEEI